MEGELEKKIRHEVSEPQIRALAVIRRSVNELYLDVHSELIGKYISNKEEVDRWNGLSPEDRVENLPEFLESLKGRWTSDLATQFCPPNLNQNIAEQVVLKILKKAVKKGDLNQETADKEYRYRCSVGSFLVSEDFVERLGRGYFILYNEDRGIYYPTNLRLILLNQQVN